MGFVHLQQDFAAFAREYSLVRLARSNERELLCYTGGFQRSRLEQWSEFGEDRCTLNRIKQLSIEPQ